MGKSCIVKIIASAAVKGGTKLMNPDIAKRQIAPKAETSMRAAAFPGEDPQTLPAPDAIAPAFLQLLSADCTDHGQLFKARDMLGL